MSRKKTFEEVENIINSLGFKLITTEYINDRQKLELEDKEGYKYHVKLDGIKNPLRFSDSNIFTIYNIKHWLKLNNKPIELISDTYTKAINNDLLWKCLKEGCSEIFSASWNNISRNKGCPYCKNKKINISNCLATKNPELAKEWHPTKNGELTPYNVSSGCGKIVWWQCDEEHEWETTIASRNYGNHSCPFCAEFYPSKEHNFLVDHPDCAKEWDYNKNKGKPEDYLSGSEVRVWWKCSKCSNEWNTRIADRHRGCNCPRCKQSKGEIKVENWLKDNNFIFEIQYKIPECKNQFPLPFDFAIFEDKNKTKLQCLIEYDGLFHYEVARFSKDENKMLNNLNNQKFRDKIKDDYCLDNNINLIRIPYWEFDNIEDILSKSINNINNQS